MLQKDCLQLAYDEEMGEYFSIWKPVFIGTGKTRREALQDLRQVAHFGVDAFIRLAQENINKTKEV